MKKYLLPFIIILVVSFNLFSKENKLIISNDTLMYDSIPTGENAFDTVIVQSGATLTLTHIDQPDAFKGSYNLQAHKLFFVEPGAAAKGLPGMEGYLAVNGGEIINAAGNDSIHNISLNLYESVNISGYPSSVVSVVAGWRGRHITIDSTVTFKGDIFEGHKNSIFIGSGDTLVLGDTAEVTHYNPALDGGSEKDKDYAHIVFMNNSIVKRVISADDIGVTDTLPLGFTTNTQEANWVAIKLNPGVTFGPDPYITLELIQGLHPQALPASDYLNAYLKVRGHDINNLDYDITLNFSASNHIMGDINTLVNCFHASDWYMNGSVVDTISPGYTTLQNLTEWGDVTAFGDIYYSQVWPNDGGSSIQFDSIFHVQFDQHVDSVDFSGISVYDEAMNSVTGLTFSLDTITNTLTINHDSLTKYNELYTVYIPAGIVLNTDSIINPEIQWSFTTIMPPPEAELMPADGDTAIEIDSTISLLFDQPIDSVNFSNITIESKLLGTVNITSSNIKADNRTLQLMHDGFGILDSITVSIPGNIVKNSDGVGNRDTSWIFTTRDTLPPPDSLVLQPAQGDTAINIDTVVSIAFDQDVDSADFSNISITDSAMAQVTGISTVWDNTSNKIKIQHDNFSTNKWYIVNIPEGTVKNIDGVYNMDISWSFKTKNIIGNNDVLVNENDIVILPNPANDFITIYNANGMHISIFNMSGTKIINTDAETDLLSLDLSRHKPGNYVVKITGKNEIITKKLIIK